MADSVSETQPAAAVEQVGAEGGEQVQETVSASASASEMFSADDPTQLIAGTLPRIVRYMAYESKAAGMVSFFYSYSAFGTPSELLDALEEAHETVTKEAELEEAQISQKSALFLYNLVAHYSLEFLTDDESFVSRMFLLAGKMLTSNDGEQLREKLETRIAAASHAAKEAPPPLLARRSDLFEYQDGGEDVLAFTSAQLAEALCLVKQQLYYNITRDQMLHWTDPSHSPALSEFASHFNMISSWVASEVVAAAPDLTRQVELVKQFITVGYKLLMHHNYNSAVEILCGLNNSSVQRLRQVWDAVPNKYHTMLKFIETQHSPLRNFSAYRQALAEVTGPHVPYLAAHIKDLTFADDGNASRLGDGLLNFDKMKLFGSILVQLYKGEKMRYRFQIDDDVRHYLDNIWWMSDSDIRSCSMAQQPRNARPSQGPKEDKSNLLSSSASGGRSKSLTHAGLEDMRNFANSLGKAGSTHILGRHKEAEKAGIDPNDYAIDDIMAGIRKEMDIRPRLHYRRILPDCLVASELVTYLVEKDIAKSREEARALGQFLFEKEVLQSVDPESPCTAFSDSYLFLRLNTSSTVEQIFLPGLSDPDDPKARTDHCLAVAMANHKIGVEMRCLWSRELQPTKCFSGKAAVAWITQNMSVEPSEALLLASRLCERKYIVPTTAPASETETPAAFEAEDEALYRFNTKQKEKRTIKIDNPNRMRTFGEPDSEPSAFPGIRSHTLGAPPPGLFDIAGLGQGMPEKVYEVLCEAVEEGGKLKTSKSKHKAKKVRLFSGDALISWMVDTFSIDREEAEGTAAVLFATGRITAPGTELACFKGTPDHFYSVVSAKGLKKRKKGRHRSKGVSQDSASFSSSASEVALPRLSSSSSATKSKSKSKSKKRKDSSGGKHRRPKSARAGSSAGLEEQSGPSTLMVLRQQAAAAAAATDESLTEEQKADLEALDAEKSSEGVVAKAAGEAEADEESGGEEAASVLVKADEEVKEAGKEATEVKEEGKEEAEEEADKEGEEEEAKEDEGEAAKKEVAEADSPATDEAAETAKEPAKEEEEEEEKKEKEEEKEEEKDAEKAKVVAGEEAAKEPKEGETLAKGKAAKAGADDSTAEASTDDEKQKQQTQQSEQEARSYELALSVPSPPTSPRIEEAAVSPPTSPSSPEMESDSDVVSPRDTTEEESEESRSKLRDNVPKGKKKPTRFLSLKKIHVKALRKPSSSTSVAAVAPVEEEDECVDYAAVASEMADKATGVAVDAKAKSFSGKEGTAWLMQHLSLPIADAVQVGNAMLQRKLIRSVTKNRPFTDADGMLYRVVPAKKKGRKFLKGKERKAGRRPSARGLDEDLSPNSSADKLPLVAGETSTDDVRDVEVEQPGGEEEVTEKEEEAEKSEKEELAETEEEKETEKEEEKEEEEEKEKDAADVEKAADEKATEEEEATQSQAWQSHALLSSLVALIHPQTGVSFAEEDGVRTCSEEECTTWLEARKQPASTLARLLQSGLLQRTDDSRLSLAFEQRKSDS